MRSRQPSRRIGGPNCGRWLRPPDVCDRADRGSGPADITYLDGHVVVGWQNRVGTKGEPGPSGQTYSTLVEYGRAGTPLHSWQLTGKVDGLGADPGTRHVIATVNQDGNSSLYTVRTFGRSRSRVTHYRY